MIRYFYCINRDFHKYVDAASFGKKRFLECFGRLAEWGWGRKG